MAGFSPVPRLTPWANSVPALRASALIASMQTARWNTESVGAGARNRGQAFKIRLRSDATRASWPDGDHSHRAIRSYVGVGVDGRLHFPRRVVSERSSSAAIAQRRASPARLRRSAVIAAGGERWVHTREGEWRRASSHPRAARFEELAQLRIAPPVAPVDALDVAAEEPVHAARERAFGCLDGEVVVLRS
jgi:hypothetical protein